MPAHHRYAREYLTRLLETHTLEELQEQLQPHTGDLPPRIPGATLLTPEALRRRWELLPQDPEIREALLDPSTSAEIERYHHNIENGIGTVKIPVGLAGPLRVNGLYAKGDFYVPMATTEAALVASYSRGACLLSAAGGCTAMLLSEGINRAPGFAFRNLAEAGLFSAWVLTHVEELKQTAEATTRHGKLVDLRLTVEGNHVYLDFEFHTSDASGQNMVTIATEAICDYIREQCPISARYAFVESNLSGDKKATAQSFVSVRGRKVAAEATLPADLVEKHLHCRPDAMLRYHQMSVVAGSMSGSIGVQGHFANGLAALYIACGQDAACVAESAVGVTRLEATEEGDLYAAVTLPDLVVGTVGGGTGLPSQQACLKILGLAGMDKAAALAEVCAALLLSGELSIIGAIAAGEFTRAHQRLARGRGPAHE